MNFHIIIDHPWKGSFNYAILTSFIQGLQSKQHNYDLLDLNQEEFNPVMSELELANYYEGISFDPKISEYQRRLSAADHLAIIFPIWWNVMPSRLKGWMDKVLLPGFAFSLGQFPSPLLGHIKGATILTTTAIPDVYHRKESNNAIDYVLSKGTLEFCGITPVSWLNFGETGFVSREKHSLWLEEVKSYSEKIF